MHLLLTNDDGIDARGINLLAQILAEHHELTIVAPSGQRSGYGHSISFSPLCVRKSRIGDYPAYAVDGTPADCVTLGLAKIAPEVDMVISGINDGANLGTDVFYSGTVGAAREATIFDKPSIAISMVGARVFCDPGFISEIVSLTLGHMLAHPLPKGHLLNVNIPDKPKAEIKGIRCAPMGRMKYAQNYEEHEFHKDRPWFLPKFGPAQGMQGALDDVNLARAGYVTFTPLHWDLTDHALLNTLTYLETSY